MRKFGVLGLGAALAMVAAAGIMPVYPPEPRIKRPSPEPRLRSLALREPNGLTWRSLKRAGNSGWTSPVKIKPERRKLYLSSHARQREALRELLAMRR